MSADSKPSAITEMTFGIDTVSALTLFIQLLLPKLDPKTERLVIELYSANFGQLNHLRAMHGVKYMPSILYKVRMLMIEGT